MTILIDTNEPTDRESIRAGILSRLLTERLRQVQVYGHNDDLQGGNGPETRWLGPYSSSPAVEIEAHFRDDYEDFEEETGKPTWVHLIREEVAEAFMESDPILLQDELIQVAALCVSWCEKLEAAK